MPSGTGFALKGLSFSSLLNTLISLDQANWPLRRNRGWMRSKMAFLGLNCNQNCNHFMPQKTHEYSCFTFERIHNCNTYLPLLSLAVGSATRNLFYYRE